MPMRCVFIKVVVMICVESLFSQNQPTSVLTSMVETERAFAAMSLEKGMKTAFLTYLADDGILFRPGPGNGKKLWQQRPDSSAARLEWAPIFADIAESGDVGYTTGWWVLTLSPDLDQPPGHGYFVTVWKKQPDETWRFALDLGIGNEHPEKVDKTFYAPEVSGKAHKKGTQKIERARIRKLESRYSKLSRKSTGLAIQELAAESIRLYRDGDVPSVNRGQALERLGGLSEQMTSSVEELFVAPSSDLAYTYGKYTATHGETTSSSYFVHIWKKNSSNEWQLVLDILNPPPPPKQ